MQSTNNNKDQRPTTTDDDKQQNEGKGKRRTSTFGMYLIEAAKKPNVEEVTRLLHNGANPDEIDKNGRTPLHWGREPELLTPTSNHLTITPYPDNNRDPDPNPRSQPLFRRFL
jgi:ankyrin repeat protein